LPVEVAAFKLKKLDALQNTEEQSTPSTHPTQSDPHAARSGNGRRSSKRTTRFSGGGKLNKIALTTSLHHNYTTPAWRALVKKYFASHLRSQRLLAGLQSDRR